MTVARDRPRSRPARTLARAGSALATVVWLVALAPVPPAAHGETSITGSGLGTRISRDGTTVSIRGGTRAGDNLFHSFGRFSVGSGDTARFDNPNGASIINIIGRVTGGFPSSISGTVDTLAYPGANLFLINPAGIIIGRGARLSVDGSVHLGTSDSLRFAAGPVFHALPDANRDRVLSVASPVAFGFLELPPGSITVRDAALEVPAGRTLSLVGGHVSVADSTLTASGGRVQIASVASPPADVPVSPGLEVSPGASLGPIALRNVGIDVGGEPAGSVVIRGGELIARGSTISATNRSPLAAPAAVDIDIAGTVQFSAASRIDTASFGFGRSGDVRIEADRIVIDGSRIDTTAFLAGAGGDVRLTADRSVTISGADAGFFTTTAASVETGVGGRLIVEAPTVTLANGAQLVTRTFRAAAGGDILVDAHTLDVSGGSVLFSRTSGAPGGDVRIDVDGHVTMSGGGILTGGNLGGSGEALVGDITMNVGSLRLTDGAGIDSGDTAGRTGNVSITAAGLVVIEDGSRITSQAFAQQIGGIRVSAETLHVDHGFILASTFGASGAGDVTLSVGALRLLNGGQIVSSSEAGATGPGGNIDVVARGSVMIAGSSPDGLPVTPLVSTPHSGLFSTAAGSGRGGRIAVRSPELVVADAGEISVATTGAGAGGSIDIRANDVRLLNGATISATSSGTGEAGNINVVFGERFQLTNSNITTESADAPGGNITITSTGSLLYLLESQITTSVHGGLGGGGDITIGTQAQPLDFVVLTNGGIHADAHGGPGGNIDIHANAFFTNVPIERAVTASSTLSTPGTINISAPVTDVSASLAELPSGLLEAAALLRAACATRLAEGKASSLVVAGREGVPFEPGGLLPGGFGDARLTGRTSGEPGIPAEIPPLRLSYWEQACARAR